MIFILKFQIQKNQKKYLNENLEILLEKKILSKKKYITRIKEIIPSNLNMKMNQKIISLMYLD